MEKKQNVTRKTELNQGGNYQIANIRHKNDLCTLFENFNTKNEK